MKALLLAGFAGAVLSAVPAAAQRTCGTMPHQQWLEQQNPQLARQREQVKNRITSWQQQPRAAQRQNQVVTVPVVVHVVYSSQNQNIPDAQILSQIAVLNEDFRRRNADTVNTPAAFAAVAADAEVEFCLAQQDPDGNPTTGIVRRQTSVSTFTDNDAVKITSRGGDDAWDTGRYLNIWVCRLGGGLLGYAQFPGGPAATDGVVILYSSFGRTNSPASAPYNKGRTTTHEVGHWLDLYHIWGDDGSACSGSDLVGDTPNQAGNNYGCPTFPRVSCNNGPNGDMFQNYMDYTDDACMNLFTQGQKNRVVAALQTARASLLSSPGCQPVVLQNNDAALSAVLSPRTAVCAATFRPRLRIKNFGTTALTSVTVRYRLDSAAWNTYAWTGNLASLATDTFTLPALTAPAGPHSLQVQLTSPNGTTDPNLANNSLSVSFTTLLAGQPLPLAESFEGATFPPTGWTLMNPDNNLTWEVTDSASVTGSHAVRMPNYVYASSGAVDELVLPLLDLTTMPNPQLSFQLAYKLYSSSGYSDTLQVLISTDCGQTFQSLYRKFGYALTTGGAPVTVTRSFIPTAAQWRLEQIDLSAYAASPTALLRIRHATDFENNLYLDDINVGSVLGAAAPQALHQHVRLYPNPTDGLLQLELTGPAATAPGHLRLLDHLGRTVRQQAIGAASGSTATLHLQGLPNGLYVAEISSGAGMVREKVVLTR